PRDAPANLQGCLFGWTAAQPPAARDAAKLADALYRIADTAAAARDMPSFYASIHKIVSELIYADNFYIALYDEARQRVNFAFFVDEADDAPPDPNEWETLQDHQGATVYVLRPGKPLFLDPDAVDDLLARGAIDTYAHTPTPD